MRKFGVVFLIIFTAFIMACDSGSSPGEFFELQQVADPVLNPPAGELASVPVEILFSSETEEAVFYYTLDGSEPTATSTSGSSCTLTEASTLRIKAVKEGMTDSNIVTAAYTVFQAPSDDPALAAIEPSEGLFSPAFDPDQLSYTLIVSEKASDIRFTPISRGPGAEISLQSTTLVSGEESAAFSISNGVSLTLHVVAEDGIQERDYQLNIQVVDQDSWELNTPDGPRSTGFYKVDSSNDGSVLVATTGHESLYYSTDSGLSWEEYSVDADDSYSWYSLAVSADGNVIAAGYDNLFVISRDKGLNWDTPEALCEYRINDIALSGDGSIIYIATDSVDDDYLCMSTDTGNTWTDLDGSNSPGPGRWGIVECSSDGSLVIAASSVSTVPGIWLSSDSGSTWTENSSIPNKCISMSDDGTKIAAANGNAYLHTSTDSGASWDSQTGDRANKVFYSPDGSLLFKSFYTSDTDDIAYSTDDGANWTEYNDIGWELVSAAMNSDGSNIVAASRTIGYLRTTTDTGLTWGEISNLGIWDWCDVDISSDGQYQAAIYSSDSRGRIYQSSNYGEDWAVNSALDEGVWSYIALSDDGTKIAVCNDNDGIIALSSDSGSSWDYKNVGPVTSTIEEWNGISMSLDGQVILASQHYLDTYLSTDGGNSWSTISIAEAPANPYWNTISVSDDGNTLLLGADEVWLSTDKGGSWELIKDNAYIDGGTLSADGQRIVVYRRLLERLYYSDDQGESWSDINLESDQPPVDVCLSQYGDGIIVAVGQTSFLGEPVLGNLIVSMNAGKTWTELEGPGQEKWSGIDASHDLSVICGVAMEASGIWINR